MEPTFILDNESIIDQEEFTTTDTLDNDLSNEDVSIDWTSIISESDMNHSDNASVEPIVKIKNGSVSFSANFMPEEELETMVILENISELGDCRELGLLYDIIEENNSELIIERANELIEKFSYQSPRPNDLFGEEKSLALSLFTDI